MKSAQILIVENEGSFATAIQNTLEGWGYHVPAVVASGEEAIRKALEVQPDLVLVGAKLEGPLDGIEVAERLRFYLEVPIIYLAEAADEATLDRAKVTEPSGYLLKPFRDAELKAQLELALYKRQHEREAHFQVLYEFSPTGIYLTDPQGQILQVNLATATILGLSPTECLDNGWMQALHEDDRDWVYQSWISAIRAGRDYAAECRLIQTAQEGRWVQVKSRPVWDDSGTVLGYVGTIEDITERKRIEENLQHTNERFHLAVKVAKAIIYDWNLGNNTVDRTEGITEVLGYHLEETETTEAWWMELIHPDDVDRMSATINEALVDKPGFVVEYRIRSKSGEYRHLWDRGIIVRDTTGRAVRIVGSSLDVTDLKQAETLLRQSEERYQLIARATNDVIWDWDLITNKVIWNEALFTAFKYEVKELSPDLDWWFSRIHPNDLERVKAGIYAVIERGGHVWMDEYHFRRSDGFYAIVLDRGYVAYDEQGKPVRMIGSMLDLTERRQAEEALRQSEEKLLQAQKMEAVGRLAGGIAHDFNNLLTAIIGYSDISLQALHRNDPLRQNIEEIKKASERAASLTQQLLAFSRKQVLQPKIIDLNIIVINMDKMLRRLIGEDIDLLTQLAPALGRVKADPNQIEQVIVNLAINARDAMPLGGKLTLETANVELDTEYVRKHPTVEPGLYVMLAVSDNGAGMDEATLSRVFEPFFTTKELGKGTGLGLSTVYGIINQSGGHIWTYSEKGRGTTFKLYLPRIDEPDHQSINSAPTRKSDHGTETILLVEDEELVRNLTQRILEMNGYSVLVVANGQEALALCEQYPGPIHLLLTDVIMPHMSGRALADQLTVLKPEMRVLYMSGYTENAIVHHGVLDQGTHFIEKPFRLDSLLDAVRRALET